jgi:uncharacterized protein YjiS (DUF1127 family)
MSAIFNAGHPPARSLLRFLDNCLNGIALHFIRRTAIACLCERDDRELRDIGIVRSEIRAAVHGLIDLPRPGKEPMIVPSPALQAASPSANGHAPAHAAILGTTTYS